MILSPGDQQVSAMYCAVYTPLVMRMMIDDMKTSKNSSDLYLVYMMI